MRYIKSLSTPAIIGAALVVVLSSIPSSASATPIFAGFPPPGGAAFFGSGGALTDPGGRTRNYSGFDLSGASWSMLYFDITGGNYNSFLETNLFDTRFAADGGFGIASVTTGGNLVEWDFSNTFSFINSSTGATITTGVQLVTRFYQADGVTPISGLNLVPSTSGDGLPRVVLEMSTADLAGWGGGFKVTQEYQTSSGVALGTFYNANNGGAGGLNTGTGAAFWYDPPVAVPEPASMVLLGSGLVGVAGMLRRRKTVR